MNAVIRASLAGSFSRWRFTIEPLTVQRDESSESSKPSKSDVASCALFRPARGQLSLRGGGLKISPPALAVAMPTLLPTAAGTADADRAALHTTASGVPFARVSRRPPW